MKDAMTKPQNAIEIHEIYMKYRNWPWQTFKLTFEFQKYDSIKIKAYIAVLFLTSSGVVCYLNLFQLVESWQAQRNKEAQLNGTSDFFRNFSEWWRRNAKVQTSARKSNRFKCEPLCEYKPFEIFLHFLHKTICRFWREEVEDSWRFFLQKFRCWCFGNLNMIISDISR